MWCSFENLVKFLDYHLADNYRELGSEILQNYQKLGCNIPHKVYPIDPLTRPLENVCYGNTIQREIKHKNVSFSFKRNAPEVKSRKKSK